MEHLLRKKGIKLDNRFVVSYNRNILVKYDAHINIEICNQHRSIKYLFKYVNKRLDRKRVSMEIENNGQQNNQCEILQDKDEIKAYLDYRYISSMEACWRIFKIDMYYREPIVERLPFHLENEQIVIFDPMLTLTENIRLKTNLVNPTELDNLKGFDKWLPNIGKDGTLQKMKVTSKYLKT
ncbi:uncharacterized protein LOC116124426 [Pistacia vera]|uniref:uncharacterized protein LOC116124426 n=1 Tax=Pistacia vera TaxID=55513 RepID=UPI001263A617|nr:uncharacterized protein LOC116124426 [Pistacia vera]